MRDVAARATRLPQGAEAGSRTGSRRGAGRPRRSGPHDQLAGRVVYQEEVGVVEIEPVAQALDDLADQQAGSRIVDSKPAVSADVRSSAVNRARSCSAAASLAGARQLDVLQAVNLRLALPFLHLVAHAQVLDVALGALAEDVPLERVRPFEVLEGARGVAGLYASDRARWAASSRGRKLISPRSAAASPQQPDALAEPVVVRGDELAEAQAHEPLPLLQVELVDELEARAQEVLGAHKVALLGAHRPQVLEAHRLAEPVAETLPDRQALLVAVARPIELADDLAHRAEVHQRRRGAGLVGDLAAQREGARWCSMPLGTSPARRTPGRCAQRDGLAPLVAELRGDRQAVQEELEALSGSRRACRTRCPGCSRRCPRRADRAATRPARAAGAPDSARSCSS
ncbi:MAG: hypothetical protein U0470_06215 [Anaerolineae bacterium]